MVNRHISASLADNAPNAGDAVEDDLGDDELKDAARLLAYLGGMGDVNFGSYRPASLLRRIRSRLVAVGIDDYDHYLDHLKSFPSEYERLVASIPVLRTEFFRDPGAWEYLADEVVPRLRGSREAGRELIIWCAGCSTGEEAYTLAMVLAEALGPDTAASDRFKLYATDVSEAAIERARAGRYPARGLAAIPGPLRERFFRPDGTELVVRRELRAAVVFGRHNLLRDQPIGRLDLVSCRNTLLYFNPAARAKILAGLFLAMPNDGFLFLGQAEDPRLWCGLFEPDCVNQPFFRKARLSSCADARGLLGELSGFPGWARRPRS
jgi:two-component system CheB/CheR fusion protein